MEIYFLRHGEAEPLAAGISDEQRRLTQKGERDVRAMAGLLRHAGVRPDRLLCSPLLRARQSANLLAEALGVAAQPDDRVLCAGSSLGSIQAAIADHPGDRILLVGHEPHCSRIVADLIGGGNTKVSAAGLARVDCERVEPTAGVLVWLLAPAVCAPPPP